MISTTFFKVPTDQLFYLYVLSCLKRKKGQYRSFMYPINLGWLCQETINYSSNWMVRENLRDKIRTAEIRNGDGHDTASKSPMLPKR